MSAEAQPAPAPKKSRKGIVVILLLLVLIGGGGAAAYWFLKGRPASAAEPPPSPPSVVSFDPFVVNLADAGGTRYLRLSLALVVANAEEAKRFTEETVLRMRLRSAILEMLAQENAAHLMTPAGKAALKAAIAARASEAAEDLKISDVLFSEFIVQ